MLYNDNNPDTGSGSGNAPTAIPPFPEDDKRGFLTSLWESFRDSGTPGVGQSAPGNPGGYEGGGLSTSGSAAPPTAAPPAPPPQTPAPPTQNSGPQQSQAGPSDQQTQQNAFLDSALGNLKAAAGTARVGSGAPSQLTKDYVDSLGYRGDAYASITKKATDSLNDLSARSEKNYQDVSTQTDLAKATFDQRQAENDKHRAELQQESKQRDISVQNEIASLRAQGIDPNRYWKNQGTAGTISNAIAIGLGAFAANGRFGNGQSPALNMITSAIDRDVDAQKTELMKNLNLTKFQGEMNQQYFTQQDALLKAEADSYLTGFNVSKDALVTKGNQFQNNADVQKAVALGVNALDTQKLDRISNIEEQRYKLRLQMQQAQAAAAAAPAQRSQKMLDQIRENAMKIYTDSKGAISMDQALRDATQAQLLVGGMSGAPGQAGGQGWGMSPQEKANSTVLVGGKPIQAVNAEKATEFGKFLPAWTEQQRLLNTMDQAWKSQNLAAYNQARAAFIENAPKVYGFARGPSGAQAGEGSHDDAAIKGTVSGQIPEMSLLVNDPHYWGNKGATMLKGVRDHLNSEFNNNWSSTFTQPSPLNPLGMTPRGQ